MLFILATDVNVYRSLHMNAPVKSYPLLALVCEDNLSLPSYRTDSFTSGFPKLASFKFTPFLKFLTVTNWSNVKFRCSLTGPKVRILNTLTPLASIYVTFFHCCRPRVNSFTRLTNFFRVQACLTLQIFPHTHDLNSPRSCQGFQSQSSFLFFFQLFLPHTLDSDKVETVSLLHLP